jgi:hypothetical protein
MDSTSTASRCGLLCQRCELFEAIGFFVVFSQRSVLEPEKSKPQISPLRYAPVEMTNLFGSANHRSQD